MMSRLAKNTMFLTIASIGQKAIAFVYFLFLARIMMPEQTGIYFLAVSISMIFSVIADFGITPVIIREIAKHPDDTHKLIRRTLTVKFPLLFIGYFLAVGSTFLMGYEIQILSLVLFTGLVLILDSIHLFFYGVLRGHHILSIESIGMFSGQLITAIVGALILWLHPSLQLLVLALMAGSLTNVVLSSSVLIRKFGFKLFLPILDWKFIRFLLKAALPFALAAIFVKVYSYVDTVFISKFMDATSVGLYGLAYKFTYAFQFLPLAFIAALYPNLSSLIDSDNENLSKTFNRSMWYMLILSTPIVFGLWLIAPNVVLLAGDSYSASAPVLSVLIFVLFPIFLDFPIGSLLNAANKQSTKTTIMGITMVLNIILNVLFIPNFGIKGAAYAALISFSLMFLMGLYFVPKVILSFKFAPLLKNSILIVGSGIIMVVIGKLLITQIGWLAVIPICVIAYIACLFVTGMITRNDFKTLRSSI
ncbi:flippase [Candidatus Uhrbacteria bacterium]|nr:flippase [Candidatus Uhrbacteria bacterium]